MKDFLIDTINTFKEISVMFKESNIMASELEKKCGIISSHYPPSDIYPEGHKIEYAFPIDPKRARKFVNFDNYNKIS
jgi:hypothetical protein